MNIEAFYNGDGAKRFYSPAEIYVGNGISLNAVNDVSGYEYVALVVDRYFVNSPVCKGIIDRLGEARVALWVLDGTPYVQDVYDFIAGMKTTPDLVVSIGGGSASDFAKSVILEKIFGQIGGAGYNDIKRIGTRIKPKYLAIPTTAGSGAEASRYCVIYDKETKGKVFGRSWEVVADWIYLDPDYLHSMPEDILACCAFDAFVHLLETYVIKHERSAFGDMISLYWIPRIMSALDHLFLNKADAKHAYEDLMYAATIAGVGISNIRTGNIHEAAGALLEMARLSHGETLFVFFREGVEYYQGEVADRTRELLAHLKLFPEFTDLESLQDIVCWWERLFDKVGLSDKISRAVTQIDQPYSRVRDHIFQRVYTDKVWIGKESPRLMGESDVDEFISRSLARFGFLEQ